MTPAAPPAAVLFDLDGTLLDTEVLKAEAHVAVMASFGVAIEEDAYGAVLGGSFADVLRGLAAGAGHRAPDAATYRERFDHRYAALLARARPMPGAADLLDALIVANVRLALVTSSERWMLDALAERIDLFDCFEVVVAAADAARHKPAPDPYLAALARLGLATGSTCVAVEDTDAGLASASAAGCGTLAVRHRLNGAHRLAASLGVVGALSEAGPCLGLAR